MLWLPWGCTRNICDVILKKCIQKCFSAKKKNMQQLGLESWTKACISCTQVQQCGNWAVDTAVFSGIFLEYSPFLHFKLTTERQLNTALTHDNKLEIGRWCLLHFEHLMCRYGQFQASYKDNRQTNGQTDNLYPGARAHQSQVYKCDINQFYKHL